ncbi:MAG: hypothetical protein ABIR97_07290 [Terracoccus sp.]
MTARRDERQTARTARAVALQRIAAAGAELAAIPGWLLVGQPARLVDPAQRTAAERALALEDQLDLLHRGVRLLDAELDALDGQPTANAFLFQEWSAWLAAVPDASTLLDQLTPDPRRQFLAATPEMTMATAQQIVDVVAANGGRVGDGQTFVDAAGLSDDDVFDLDHTASTRLDPLADAHVIGVLLPMRLETRYQPHVDGDPWRLRIRVHPDPVALAGPPLPPSAQEAELVAACWTQADGDLTSDRGAAAFTALAGTVGGARACYLLREVPVLPLSTGFTPELSYDDQGHRGFDYRAALPEVLQLWGDSGTGLRMLGELHPDLEEIARQGTVDQAMAGMEPDQVPGLWWTSFEVAARVQLALEVELPDGPHLDILLVTGLAERDPRSLVEALADQGTLGLVPPLAATNTVAGQATLDTGRDPARWLAVARSVGSGTAGGLAGVLSSGSRLDGVAAVDTGMLEVVPPLVTALWPVLWQRWLKDVENSALTRELGGWAARNLHPLGAWPAVRVGDVPYGVLPAVDVAGWVPAPHDGLFEQGVTQLLGALVPAWATAAAAGGTALGADAETLLDVLGRVPTSRQLGSRAFLPLEIVALLQALVNGTSASDTLAAWQELAGPALEHEPEPARRYQAFGYVQPAVVGKDGLGETLKRYLDMGWEELAFVGDGQDDDPPLLARLVRQSLLLTQAEVSRVNLDAWPQWTRRYLPDIDAARTLANDAQRGDRVDTLPQYAQDRLDRENPPDADVQAIVRQFLDVREAVRELVEHDEDLGEDGIHHPALTAVIDTSSHRIDPWVSAVGARRLRRLMARDVPRRLGAYGWVDDLDPSADPTPPTAAGLLHAPGNAQALTTAVLRDHVIHDDDTRWQITARSDLVRVAAKLGADVRLGIHLSEALGREIERRAGDPAAVLELRRRFPARPEWAGRRVCDGQLALAAPPATLPAAVGGLDDLREALDTYGDLLVGDAVHDVVSGRAAAAQESMNAAAGLGAPPELRVLQTQRQGSSVRTTVLVAVPVGASDPASPVTVADPAFSALLESEIGPASDWTWTLDAATVTLADLELTVADAVLIPQSRLDALAAAALGGAALGGTATTRRRALDRLGSLLDVQRGLPDLVGATADGAGELRDRLTALRSLAAEVATGLAANPPVTGPMRAWGLPDSGALEVLEARIVAAGDPMSDPDADPATLAERLLSLLSPASGLPLICTGTLTALTAAPDLDRDWLEVVASVRPAISRLEAHQLTRAWPAAASDPARLWSVPVAAEQIVLAYGPAATTVGPVGIALLDDWAETVPSSKHTTHAAFGFDAPRARAPQSILLAVPPDERTPLTAEALPSLVMSTRQLSRARMAQPDRLLEWSVAVPTSMVLAAGPAGSDLVGQP